MMGLLITININFPHILDIYKSRSENRTRIELFIARANCSVTNSRELLDQIIKDKLTEWQIYNLDTTSENYMNSSQIDSCIKYIIKKICNEMTPTLKDQLSIGYPMDTMEDMVESIKNRAKLIVLNYSIKQNMPHDNFPTQVMKTFD